MKTGFTDFEAAVYRAVQSIPAGRVSTYGRIAALAGRPGAARAVGNILHRNPMEGTIPCHRVVNAQGRASGSFAFGGMDEQLRRLAAEGVASPDSRVSLAVYGWPADWSPAHA